MSEFLETLTVLEIATAVLLMAALLMAGFRLLHGPTTGDRIVAADTLNILVTVVIIGFAVVFTSALYLDVALLYVTLAFIGVVAIARAVDAQRRERKADAPLGSAEDEA